MTWPSCGGKGGASRRLTRGRGPLLFRPDSPLLWLNAADPGSMSADSAALRCGRRPIPQPIAVSAIAGGGNDLIARIVAAKLQDKLGQPVVVDNKPGAQSIVAAELVAKARARRLHAADGAERPDHHQSRRLRQAALRSGEGLRADLAARRVPAAAGGRRRAAGEVGEGAGRVRPRQSASSPTTPPAPRPSSSPRSCSTSAPARTSSTSPIAAAAMPCRRSWPGRC